MVNITLPDGNLKTFEKAPTGLELAESISADFARNCVAMELNDELVDLSTSISEDTGVRLITRKDPEALHVLRHSAAHVMAQAILRIFKDAKLTIGPAIEDGFYYDIDMQPVSEEDFPRIEAEIKKIIKAKLPIYRKEVSKAEALEFYKDEPYKQEMIAEMEDGTMFPRRGQAAPRSQYGLFAVGPSASDPRPLEGKLSDHRRPRRVRRTADHADRVGGNPSADVRPDPRRARRQAW